MNITRSEYQTKCVLFRLNYAVDLRYGVLVDIAKKVHAGEPVDVTVPAFNAIWQGDANSYALRALGLCSSPPRILNVTGPEIVLVREVAHSFAGQFGRVCEIQGEEGNSAAVKRCISLSRPAWRTFCFVFDAEAVGGRLGNERRRKSKQANSF